MRRALLILIMFTRSIGRGHPHLDVVLGNYRGLLEALKEDSLIQIREALA